MHNATMQPVRSPQILTRAASCAELTVTVQTCHREGRGADLPSSLAILSVEAERIDLSRVRFPGLVRGRSGHNVFACGVRSADACCPSSLPKTASLNANWRTTCAHVDGICRRVGQQGQGRESVWCPANLRATVKDIATLGLDEQEQHRSPGLPRGPGLPLSAATSGSSRMRSSVYHPTLWPKAE